MGPRSGSVLDIARGKALGSDPRARRTAAHHLDPTGKGAPMPLLELRHLAVDIDRALRGSDRT